MIWQQNLSRVWDFKMALNEWIDINKKILNFEEEEEELIPYRDYDPDDINDPNNPDNPLRKKKMYIDLRDKQLQPIRNSLTNIFNTRLGELPGLPEFGSNLGRYLFEQMDVGLQIALERDIQTTIERWEPRVIITSIDTEMNYDYNEVILNVKFRIRGDNENREFEHKLVYDYTS